MRPGGVGIALLGLALLAAGFGVGLFVAGSREKVVITTHVDVPAAPAPAATPSPDSAPAPAAAMPEQDRAALRSILERAPSREVPTGAGVITGRVRKSDGTPLPGVEVAFTPQTPRTPRPRLRPGEKPPERDPVDIALDAVLWARWFKDARRIAVTDAAGEFRAEGLAAAKHRVNATFAGWQIRPKDHGSGEWDPGADIAFVATATVELRIDLSCPEGPIPQGLNLRSKDGRSAWGLSPDHPVVHMDPGTHELFVVAGEHEELRSEPQTIVLAEGTAEATASFVLRSRPGIRGRLLFPADETWEQAAVMLQRLAGESRATAEGLRSAATNAPRRNEDTFAFPDLSPGRYGLGVARVHGGPIVAMEEVEVGDSVVTRDLSVPASNPAEVVVVRVLRPDGGVLTDFQLYTGFRGRSFHSSGGGGVGKRSDGARIVYHHPQALTDDPDGVFTITITTKDLGGATLEYRKGERSEWTVRLEEPGRVEARVTGHKGTPYEDRLHLRLVAPGSTDGMGPRRGQGTAGPDASGLQVLTGNQPGEYLLQLLLDFPHFSVPVARVPVTVRSGRNEFTVPLPELHEVLFSGAVGQVHVSRVEPEGTAAGSRWMVFVEPSDGKARVDGIPEGEYRVRSGPKSQTFRVPGTTKVDL